LIPDSINEGMTKLVFTFDMFITNLILSSFIVSCKAWWMDRDFSQMQRAKAE